MKTVKFEFQIDNCFRKTMNNFQYQYILCNIWDIVTFKKYLWDILQLKKVFIVHLEFQVNCTSCVLTNNPNYGKPLASTTTAQ